MAVSVTGPHAVNELGCPGIPGADKLFSTAKMMLCGSIIYSNLFQQGEFCRKLNQLLGFSSSYPRVVVQRQA